MERKKFFEAEFSKISGKTGLEDNYFKLPFSKIFAKNIENFCQNVEAQEAGM